MKSMLPRRLQNLFHIWLFTLNSNIDETTWVDWNLDLSFQSDRICRFFSAKRTMNRFFNLIFYLTNYKYKYQQISCTCKLKGDFMISAGNQMPPSLV